MVDAQVRENGRKSHMKQAAVKNAIVIVGAVVLVGLLAGETGAAFQNPDGVAVIIGNRAYQYDVPEVTYAHRDAEAFRRYVVDVLGFDPENVIHQKDADKATMERVFGNRDNLRGSELWRHLHPNGISDVVVFYSGHGIPGLNDKRGYLLPVNAHPDTAELNGYPIDVLYQNLVKLKEKKDVRSVHVFLDACFSGDSGGGRLIGSTSAIRVAPRIESAGLDKLTILTAASGREVASWDKAAKHGLFTHHLLNALYGAGDADADGQVTAAEAKAHLDRHMTRAARRTFGRVQNADLRGVETAVLARAVGGMFPVRPLIGPERQVGQRFRDCPGCPEMVVVPAGSYEMGSPMSEVGRQENEGPVHRVTIAQPFAVGVYEVTRGEFRRFVEATGYSAGNSCGTFENGKESRRPDRHWRNPGFPQTDQHPVVCVSWKDAQAYVQWLSKETGRAYRLLSEAEWEYVARAGTGTARYWGQGWSDQCRYANGWDKALMRRDASFKRYTERLLKVLESEFAVFPDLREAWFSPVDCDDGYAWTSPVGVYGANEFGLHDVLGNVWEAVQDCWNDSYVSALYVSTLSYGEAWEIGNCSRRVLRGGSWVYGPGFLRSALRGSYDYPRSNIVGFRVAQTLTDSAATPQAADQQQEAEALQDEALQLALESIRPSVCADKYGTDPLPGLSKNLTEYADYWGYDPEEAYAFGLKIQDAVRERDLAAFFSLVDGELEYGPRRKYVENKDFNEIFPDSWRTAILNDEPPCTPVGWRGFMLANGLIWYRAPSKEYEEYPDRENYPDDKTHLEDLELWEQGKPLKHRPGAKQDAKHAAAPAKQPGGSDTFRLVAVHDWVPEKFPPVPVGWKVDGRLLSPQCFVYEWWSSDNFDHFVEQFAIADSEDFRHNTGKYFGDPIYPFDPIDFYDKRISLWRNVNDCVGNANQLKIKGLTVRDVSEEYPSAYDEYTILADVSTNLCQELAPNLPGKCLKSYLVKFCSDGGGSIGCNLGHNIYGLFRMEDGDEIIFPLKNFDTENPARNYLDSK